MKNESDMSGGLGEGRGAQGGTVLRRGLLFSLSEPFCVFVFLSFFAWLSGVQVSGEFKQKFLCKSQKCFRCFNFPRVFCVSHSF